MKKFLQLSLLLFITNSFFAFPQKVTPQNVSSVVSETYMWSSVFILLAILISVVFSSAIKWEGGENPSDGKKRKIVFFVTSLISPVLFFLFGSLVITSIKGMSNVVVATKFGNTLMISSLIVLVGNFVIGFALSKIFSKGKFGSWF